MYKKIKFPTCSVIQAHEHNADRRAPQGGNPIFIHSRFRDVENKKDFNCKQHIFIHEAYVYRRNKLHDGNRCLIWR
jgi:hypothetical protein